MGNQNSEVEPSRAEIAQALATIILSRCGRDLDPWITFKTFKPELIALLEKQLGKSAKEAGRG